MLSKLKLARRSIVTRAIKCDEAVTFGYPRDRSFGTAGQRPLAIRDRRRVERRVTASSKECCGDRIVPQPTRTSANEKARGAAGLF
jgi:hypothetical protein